ncbi:hypothetical protein [Methanohalobium sp.]|uniref:hypothetical protein n=1 Tax=Methanohalobium sp. TaxID=2837493 RepID=UPI0025EDD8A6|nr:hypothetical protein [Methanohalobium sp.]
MANTIVKRIGELSLGKILGIIYAVIGLIIGVIVSFVTLIAGNIGMGNAIGGPAYLFGAVAIIPCRYFMVS